MVEASPMLTERIRAFYARGHSLAIIRHCKTDPAVELTPAGDKAREVNKIGAAQCAKAAGSWFAVLPVGRVVFHSEASRTRSTAVMLLGPERTKHTTFVELSRLYGGLNGKTGLMNCAEMEEAFELPENGYQPLAHYRMICAEPLARYANAAMGELLDALEGQEDDDALGECTPVFCHAVYTSALADVVAAALGVPADVLHMTNLSEVSGFHVTRRDVVHHETSL